MLFSSLLVAAVAASAAPIAKLQQREPTGWASKLEPYDTYHVRYVALGCSKQHNTQFFTDCCHPLKNGTELSSRPAYCTPNATALASASARIAKASATTAPLPSASDDADDEYCSDAAPSNSAAPTASAAVGTPIYQQAAPSAAPTTSAADAQDTPDAAPSSSTTTTEAAPSPTTTDAAPAASSSATDDGSASSAIDNNEAFAAAQPTPSSSSSAKKEKPTPAPSSQTPDQPQPTSAAPTQGGGGSGSGSGQVYGNAEATFFYQNGVAGACGTVHSDQDLIVAIDTNGWWQNTGQVSDLCGRQVRITRVSDGRQVTATIADACPTCDTNNSLDLSVGAFNQIATPDEGMVSITWQFV